MKFIKSDVELVVQGPTLIDVFKHIEKAMRNCYRSEDKINDDSYKKMIDVALTNHHLSVLEHGTIYLKGVVDSKREDWHTKYKTNPFSTYRELNMGTLRSIYITTNYRVIYENDWFDDLNYMSIPTNNHELRLSFLVDCSEAIAREWNRHMLSISQQSTRYCNYSKDKFGGEIKYIIPEWLSNMGDDVDELIKKDETVKRYCNSLKNAEDDYLYLINPLTGTKLKPEEARGILKLDTATRVFYTGDVTIWKHFIELRNSPQAHPDIRVLAQKVEKVLKENEIFC